MKERVVQVRGSRVGVAIHARAHLGKVGEVVAGARHQLLARLCNHLAAVVGFGLGNLGHMTGDQLAELAHDLGAFGRRGIGPARKRRLGGGHGRVDLLGASTRHLADHVLGRRIDVVEIVVARNALAIDKVVDIHAMVSS